jgi:hypothetical protein
VLTQQLRQERLAFQVVLDSEVGAAAVHHGPAGDADRAAVTTHVVVDAEAEALVGELIEVGRPDVFVAPGPDRVCPLIVGEQEEHVGALRRVRNGGTAGGNRRAEKESDHEVSHVSAQLGRMNGRHRST